MRLPFPLGPKDLNDFEYSKWHKQYAILPLRVENRFIWLEHFYVRFVPVRDYTSFISQNSENQWTYKWDPEIRLKENMTEEDLQNVY